MERLMKVLVVAAVVACVTGSAQAFIYWNGSQGTDFSNTSNWSVDPTNPAYFTEILRIDNASLPLATISSDITWEKSVMFKGANGAQTSGTAEFYSGQAGYPTFSIFRNAPHFDISGGSFTNWGQAGLGTSNATSIDGTGWVNISGTGSMTLLRNKYVGAGRQGLYIMDGSGISLADNATLIIDSSMADIAALIADSKIVAVGGATLNVTTYTETVNLLNAGDLSEVPTEVSFTKISAVPEPATMALLGLGALVLRRKR